MINVKKILKSNSFLYTIIGLFCLLLVCMINHYDYDLYARLIVGENFIEKGVFNYHDFLSYTPTHIWYDHEWGASVIFYLFFKLFGSFGLIILQSLLVFFTTFFIIKTQQLQKHSYPISLTFLVLFLVLYVHQNPSLIRCQLFSFLFFSMFLYFIEKYRKTNSNIIWLILPLIIIWNNVHGGVVAGLGTIFIYIIGLIITRKPCKKLILVLLSSIPLLLINPYGIDYVYFLLFANTMSRKYVVEWWPVFAHRHIKYYYPQFCFTMFAVLLCLINKLKGFKIDIPKLLVLIVTAYLGTTHVKLLSLPLIVIAALYYNEIAKLFNKKSIKILERFVCIIMVAAIFYIPFTKPFTPRTNLERFPVKEVEFLKINNIKGNILSEFGWSSYIAYKLYPNNLIYLDGRYEEVYNDTEFNKLKNYSLAEDNWQAVLNDYPTQILIPDKNINAYKALENHKGWVKIYDGENCGIFVKKENAKQKYKMPSDDVEYYKNNEFVNMGYFGKKSEKEKNDR